MQRIRNVTFLVCSELSTQGLESWEANHSRKFALPNPSNEQSIRLALDWARKLVGYLSITQSQKVADSSEVGTAGI